MAVVTQPTGNPNLLVRPEGHRDWSTGKFGCATDCGSCLCTWCCLPCMLCRLAERMDECCMMPFCVLGSLVAMRTKVRTMGGISGSICKDCLSVACCGPCIVCQMSREMDNMGL
ncbi:placenta-specific gene 8 protein-like [Haliotis rubra]|uniref:placenta-specific gene 8 protein-like n=1 Tax=Haliotis rubra TaxID=36100 RepID=UPI001EE5692F|nr:placenta-specific gene 8 protein-like [Haliotis rubra]XP_046568001.1 placenta-specific gene 8 protein-like [Haliotis rubra]XP_046568002.1 placenta-specific gene 8 protein-like [Haliotis rubra]